MHCDFLRVFHLKKINNTPKSSEANLEAIMIPQAPFLQTILVWTCGDWPPPWVTFFQEFVDLLQNDQVKN